MDKCYKNNTMKVVASPAFHNKHLNPYNYLLYSNMQKIGVKIVEARSLLRGEIFKHFDILHLHWPEYALTQRLGRCLKKLTSLWALISWAKLIGAKVVWTVHNLRPHEEWSSYLTTLFYKVLVPSIDGTILLSHTTIDLIRKDSLLYPLLDKPWTVIPHGHYRDIFNSLQDRVEARKNLGINQNAKVALFFGQIRPYKGVEHLIEVFQNYQDSSVYLLMAGKPYSLEYEKVIRDKVKDNSRIHLLLRFFSETEISLLFAACDVVILPYTAVLNSGSVLLALSFGKPVLAPRLGSLPELAAEVGEGWLMLFDPPLNSEHVARRMSLLGGSQDRLNEFMIKISWEKIAKQTLEFYKRVKG